jgi:hypothetical protein
LSYDSKLRDFAIAIEQSSIVILEQIPEGTFRSDLVNDLNNSELHFFQTISRYFNKFCEHFFEEDPQFWRIFTDAFVTLFLCSRDTVWAAIDELACRLLYSVPNDEPASLFVALDRFTLSERVTLSMKAQNFPKYEKTPISLTISPETGRPCVSAPVQDGGFIAEVPGFVCDYREMPASTGLSLQWISIPNTDFVIDTDQTSFTLCRRIRRSFHFNCEPKFVKLNGETRVALIGHRLRGPAADPFAKSPAAIPAGGELVLPLDSDLPFPVPRVEWRERRGKRIVPATRKERRKREKPPTSLLSLFYDVSVPPLPLQILSSQELSEKEKNEAMQATPRISTRRSFRRREGE